MDKMPLITLIFYSIPESILIIIFCLYASRTRFQMTQVFPIALVLSLLSYIIRAAPFAFGIHSLIGITVVFFFLVKVFHLKKKQAILATLFSFGTLLALEVSTGLFVHFQLGLTVKDVWQQEAWIRTVLGWPQLVVFSWFVFLISRKDTPLIK